MTVWNISQGLRVAPWTSSSDITDEKAATLGSLGHAGIVKIRWFHYEIWKREIVLQRFTMWLFQLRGFPDGSVKSLPVMWQTWVWWHLWGWGSLSLNLLLHKLQPGLFLQLTRTIGFMFKIMDLESDSNLYSVGDLLSLSLHFFNYKMGTLVPTSH